MSARKTKGYPKSKGDGRIAERAPAYGSDTLSGRNFPKPIRFKTSVLKAMGKPIRIVKLTEEEISAKVAALYERAEERPVRKKRPRKSNQRGGAAETTKTGTVSTGRKRKR